MELSIIFWIIWFLLTAYSIVANDSMQTLWTFMASNKKVKWQYLWLAASSVLVATLVYSFIAYSWDISYWRLEKIPYVAIEWYHLIPPIVLVILTKFWIPVSTSLLIFSVFASNLVFEKVLIKSFLWYSIALATWLILWFIASKIFKGSWKTQEKNERKWRIFQWLTTGFLWFTWLAHDVANIAVYLPRQLSILELVLVLVVFVASLGYIFYKKWGKIQEIVLEKTNLDYIKTATFIDLIYAFILLFFKQYNSIPMSTTWVFLWLIAWREIAIFLSQSDYNYKTLIKLVWKDIIKVLSWLAISIIITLFVIFISKI